MRHVAPGRRRRDWFETPTHPHPTVGRGDMSGQRRIFMPMGLPKPVLSPVEGPALSLVEAGLSLRGRHSRPKQSLD